MRQTDTFPLDVGVIGGCGHVGLPLALTFADCGKKTLIYDVNRDALARVRRGEMPFAEEGAPELLRSVLDRRTLFTTDQPDRLAECRFLVLIVGTPVDEHLNPTFSTIRRVLDQCRPHLRGGQTLVLRSTVFPGICQYVQNYLADQGLDVRVAFCPERVAQGHSLKEFRKLPQILSAFDPATREEVRGLFACFTPEFVTMEPTEAELCKLMTNAWRYIQFAIVNQFYMIATQNGLDFDRILHGCRHNYPRMAGMPGPGLTAGPCLVKDTMQLAAFSQNTFVLGHAAMLVNEGLPAHLIQLARQQTTLRDKTVAILGLSFKAESDDTRDSLSFKLKKLLMLEARRVLCHDPYTDTPDQAPLERVLEEAEVFFVATPHAAYRELHLPAERVVVDVWNVLPPRADIPEKIG